MIKETIIQLRKAGNEMLSAANKLESLFYIVNKANETEQTAKKILNSVKKKRKNPWKNPKYKAKVLKAIAKGKRAKGMKYNVK